MYTCAASGVQSPHVNLKMWGSEIAIFSMKSTCFFFNGQVRQESKEAFSWVTKSVRWWLSFQCARVRPCSVFLGLWRIVRRCSQSTQVSLKPIPAWSSCTHHLCGFEQLGTQNSLKPIHIIYLNLLGSRSRHTFIQSTSLHDYSWALPMADKVPSPATVPSLRQIEQ